MNQELIPKTIHYCWFGRNPKPPIAEKCISSWKRICPDYKIMEWNEDNFCIDSCPRYVKEAYECKKWAFVTDYVRLKLIYDYGGIYLDTDVELLRSPDSLLQYPAFFGFEGKQYIATGLGFGAVRHSDILQNMMDDYTDIPFVLADGSYNILPCPQRNTDVLLKIGLVPNGETQQLTNGIMVLSNDYLCPMDYFSGKVVKTQNTISIHWYCASWQSEEQKEKHKKDMREIRKNDRIHFIKTIPNRILLTCLGKKNYEKLKNLLNR